jgi:hypothetical protein
LWLATVAASARAVSVTVGFLVLQAYLQDYSLAGVTLYDKLVDLIRQNKLLQVSQGAMKALSST